MMSNVIEDFGTCDKFGHPTFNFDNYFHELCNQWNVSLIFYLIFNTQF